MRFVLLCLTLCVLACGDDAAAPVDAASDAGAADAGDLGRLDTAVDAAAVDAAADAEPDATDPPTRCEDGLVAAEFAAGERASFDGVAGDFSAELLDGSTYLFSDAFSSCESYVFIARNRSGESESVWISFPDGLFADSARNVHYFFVSEGPPATVVANVEAMRANIEDSYTRMAADEAAYWAERVHYVATPVNAIEGSVGELIRNLGRVPTAFAIDRAQRFDPVGSMSVIERTGFVGRLQAAAYASQYFNYRHALDARVQEANDSGAWREAVVLEQEGATAREHTVTVELPSLDDVNRLEVDVALHCKEGPADCSEWDRIAYISVCTDASCEVRNELVRWITPYSRPGRRRWVMDATRLLPLLSEGENHLFVALGPPWERETERDVRIALRLHTGDASERPSRVQPLYEGGAFDGSYADSHPPMAVPSHGASKVELVVIVSGHEQSERDNCAEWCNHVHRFEVGGVMSEVSFPAGIGERFGCAVQAASGVVPGQYGNWAPMRAGWCPGAPVQPHIFDVSEALSTSTLPVRYDASFDGGTPRGGRIQLSSYLVYYD
ncbi:MAG: peptide-N-glycosidase F-related protein [Myxococcota bacterium]